MTRRQNKQKYIYVILFGIIEVLVIIGAYAAHYFTRTRMGMFRHVVYLNGKWEKTLPIQTIKWISISIIIILAILAFLHYRKEKANSQVNMVAMLLTIAISGGTVYFLLVYNTGKNRAYYILSICYILITVLQNILYHYISSIKLKKKTKEVIYKEARTNSVSAIRNKQG